MIDLNAASTFEEDEAFAAMVAGDVPAVKTDSLTTDWQKEYQTLFVKMDKHLTRALEAEARLKIAKELLAEQEIQIARYKQSRTNDIQIVREAFNHLSEARKHLNSLQGYYQ